MPDYQYAGKKLGSFSTVKRWMFKLQSKHTGIFDESSTKRNALYYLGRYCEMLELNPNQIIEQRRSDRKSDEETTRRRHEEHAEKFNLLIRETGTVNSAQTALGHIRSFYKWNYEPLTAL